MMGETINRGDAEQDQRLKLLEYRMQAAEEKIDKMSVAVDKLSAAANTLLGTVDTMKYWIYGINAVTVLAVVGAIINMVWG
jgi:hypothetical protein